ncbi:MAG TPA: catalase family peroxidase [Candidatus Dormibacteraeota bacterium]
MAVTDISQRLVDAIRSAYGRHPGYRAAHAKGTCCSGVFTGSPEARELSKAAVFSGAPVPATIRFSNGSGDPSRPDTALDGRGMAVKFHLAGAELDFVSLSQPVFFVRDLESFIEFTQVRGDRLAVEAWAAGHPEAVGALLHLATTPAAASYLDLSFHGLHAFALVDAAGERRWARYSWVPRQPGQPLTSEERKARNPDYLQQELFEHLAARPATYDLVYQLAGPEDPVDDPTLMWPDEREKVVAGHLDVQAVVEDQDGGCSRLVFDPMHLVDGIEPSADPILLARPGAYSISITERLGD